MKKYFLLLILLGLFGCDFHKKEREALQSQLAPIKTEFLTISAEIEDIERNITNLHNEMLGYRDGISNNKSEYEKNKLELAKYIMDHKFIAASIAAGATGAAGVINENLSEEDRQVLAAMALIGGAICLFNAEEATEVSTRIGYYGYQIENFKSNISDLAYKLSKTESFVDSLETVRAAKRGKKLDLQVRVDDLTNRIKELE